MTLADPDIAAPVTPERRDELRRQASDRLWELQKQQAADALREEFFDLLQNAAWEIDGAIACLRTADDVGLKHHSKRLFHGLSVFSKKLKDTGA